jgi:hypothetical protein
MVLSFAFPDMLRKIWRYQRGKQKPLIKGQTTQWPKEVGQKNKQLSTKHCVGYSCFINVICIVYWLPKHIQYHNMFL